MAIEPSGWMRNRNAVAGVGGALAALLALAAAPAWAALPVGVAGFFALRWFFSPRGLFRGLAPGERPRVELAREVLAGAAHELAALAEAARQIEDRRTRAAVERLAGKANGLCGRLERTPARLLQVQRLLTFYLPSARQLAEGYAALERTPEAAGRSAETRRMLERLDGLFDDYARRLAAPDDEALEVELQLLEQSLQEERARQRVRVR